MILFPSVKERRAAAAAALAAGLLIAQQVTARAVRDTLFLSAFQVRSLPFAMIASALVAVAGARTLAVVLSRRAPSRVVPAAALLSAVLLTIVWAAAPAAPRGVAVLVYIQVAAFGGALISGFWSVVNERFDPYTARRVVSRVGAGAILGGVVGGLGAWMVSDLIPVRGMLLVLAALHASAALVLLRTDDAERATPPAAAPPGRGADRVWPALVRVPYLRELALFVFLGACVEAILDYGFKAEAARRFAPGAALLGAFALFHAGVSVVSLVLQVSSARRALERLGIAGTVGLRAVLTALGSLAGILTPGIETALFARGAHESLTNSLFRSGYELFYTPMPREEKRRVKAIIDVAVDKAGTLVGSTLVLVILGVAASWGGRALFVAGLILSIGALALSRRLHGGYVRTLEQSLFAGRIGLDPDDVIDRDTRLTLARTSQLQRGAVLQEIAALRSGMLDGGPIGAAATRASGAPRDGPPPVPDPLIESLRALRAGEPDAVRRVLEAHPDPPPLLVGALIPLLGSDRLFAEVLGPLRRASGRATGQLVDALLDPAEPEAVRRRIPRVLKACATTRAAEGLLLALDDACFDVRASAASALAALNEHGVVRVTREGVLGRVREELASGGPAERELPHLFALLSLVIERRPLEIVWAALEGAERAEGERGLRGTALEYLSCVLPADVFGRLVSVLGASSFRPPRGPRRGAEQVAEELRSSSARLRLVNPPWRKPGED